MGGAFGNMLRRYAVAAGHMSSNNVRADGSIKEHHEKPKTKTMTEQETRQVEAIVDQYIDGKLSYAAMVLKLKKLGISDEDLHKYAMAMD